MKTCGSFSLFILPLPLPTEAVGSVGQLFMSENRRPPLFCTYCTKGNNFALNYYRFEDYYSIVSIKYFFLT